MYFRNNIKKENKNNNKLNNSINIIKDPKQPTIIESFNKAKEKALVSDNEMEICIHESMMYQKECIICRKEDSFINSRFIRTQYKKKNNHWKIHLYNYFNITKK